MIQTVLLRFIKQGMNVMMSEQYYRDINQSNK